MGFVLRGANNIPKNDPVVTISVQRVKYGLDKGVEFLSGIPQRCRERAGKLHGDRSDPSSRLLRLGRHLKWEADHKT